MIATVVNMCRTLEHLAFKGNGRQSSAWFNLCAAQNTPTTNSESKHYLFALHVAPSLSTVYPAKWTWTRPKCTTDRLNRAHRIHAY